MIRAATPPMDMPPQFLAEPLAYEFYQRAAICSLVIGACGGLLSACVVASRTALAVNALSQSLLPGIALAVLLAGLSPVTALAGGLVAAGGIALGSHWLSCATRLPRESALAALYVCAFAGGILLLSKAPPQVRLEDYLLGNIIGIGNPDLFAVVAVASLCALVLVAMQQPIAIALLDRDSAVTLGIRPQMIEGALLTLIVLFLIAAVKAVGVLLAVGLLVLPSVAMLPLARSPRQLAASAALCGGALAPTALIAAYWLDLPPGPAIVFLLGLLALALQLAAVLRRRLARAGNHGHSPP